MNNYNSTQILYLLSLENNKVWNQTNILICLIDDSTKINKIIFSKDKFKIDLVSNDELIEPYLERFLILLKNKMFYELDIFIENLNFLPFAERNGLIRVHKTKGFFSKDIKEKTEKYFKTLENLRFDSNYLNKLIDNKNLENYEKLSGKIINNISNIN